LLDLLIEIYSSLFKEVISCGNLKGIDQFTQHGTTLYHGFPYHNVSTHNNNFSSIYFPK